MLRSRLLALPLLAALALTACSGGSSEQAAGVAETLIRTAAATTTSTGSSKVALTSTTTIGSTNVTVRGGGAYDYVTRNRQLQFEIPAGRNGGGGNLEQRILGDELFLSVPETPGTFCQLKVADVAGTSLGNSIDPAASLQALEGVTSAKDVGQETVRGVSTTHYQGSYDVRTAIDRAQGAAKTILQATIGATGLSAIAFDVMLDQQGRAVTFEQVFELPGNPQSGGRPVRSTTMLELFDFGSAVTITAPPASKGKGCADLIARITQSGRGAGSPAAPSPVSSAAGPAVG